MGDFDIDGGAINNWGMPLMRWRRARMPSIALVGE